MQAPAHVRCAALPSSPVIDACYLHTAEVFLAMELGWEEFKTVCGVGMDCRVRTAAALNPAQALKDYALRFAVIASGVLGS